MYWRIALIFITTFVLFTAMTGTWKSASDGNDVIGFPFEFYTYLGGKRLIPTEDRTLFNYGNFTIDAILFFVSSILIDKLIKKNKNVPR